ncbi:MAG: 30S ribosomal protein S12 methylthiotransferase RimO [Bacteroidales bacterium]|nr:30S ribosomal protein S12 methylthiotransferase RimO [Bacteroidales bacterium]
MKTKPNFRKIGFVSLGCAKNLVDTEALMKQAEHNGFDIQYNPDGRDYIDAAIINTCGFIHDAKKESIDTILEFVTAKKNDRIGRLFVMGCLSERYKSELTEEIPEVDGFFGVNDFKRVLERLGGTYRQELVGERWLTTPRHYAYLKIAEGCDRRCSFCAIPSIRGNHVSRPEDEILREARILVEGGVKELNIISQDTTYFGLDTHHTRRLPNLLRNLAEIKGLDWIRLHYTYPDGFPDELFEVINSYQNICKYIDIPLQHISDRILKSMRRGINGKETRMLIEKIRNRIPGVAIRTTLIVGYPGETRSEFLELKKFVEEFKFDRLGAFTYSAEEGTSAFTFKDSVTTRTKENRLEELMNTQDQISHELNQNKIGKIMTVIIDRSEGDYFIGRSEFDSPEVDNEILIKRQDQVIAPGTFCTVRVTGNESFDLFAVIM